MLAGEHPFGVMAPAGPVEQRIALARELRVAYYRPSAAFVLSWDSKMPECDAARESGLRLVLTVRNSTGPNVPASPPTDLAAYQTVVSDIIAACRPDLLVVENEENSAALFYDGTPEAYHRQLNAACEVAHDAGIACTNGGLVSSLVAGLVAERYTEGGEPDRAAAYLQRTLGDKARRFSSAKAREQISKGRALLAGYRAAGADFVHFHWYIDDADALREAVAYLTEASGLPAVTNEIGQQKNERPEQVRAMLSTLQELRIPLAVWFSMDVPGFGGARALTDRDGRLRPNGEAFKSFVASMHSGVADQGMPVASPPSAAEPGVRRGWFRRLLWGLRR